MFYPAQCVSRKTRKVCSIFTTREKKNNKNNQKEKTVSHSPTLWED